MSQKLEKLDVNDDEKGIADVIAKKRHNFVCNISHISMMTLRVEKKFLIDNDEAKETSNCANNTVTKPEKPKITKPQPSACT